MQSYKEIIEASRSKTPEELTNYLVQRLEESRATFPDKFNSNIEGNIDDKECFSIEQIAQAVNEELGPGAYSSSDDSHFEGLGSLDEYTYPQIVRLLVSSPGLRECMYIIGRCPIVEFMTTVMKSAPPKTVCGKVLNAEQAYRCLDCQHDDSSIYCMDCFEPEKHVGHKYFITVANGVCDCGDANALNVEGFCSRHKGVDPNEDMHKYFPECYKETTRAVLRAMCRYAIVHIGDTTKFDNLRSVFLSLYILAAKLGYGFGSMLGDAFCEVHSDLVLNAKLYLPLAKYAEKFKDQQFAKSLLWYIVFYNELIEAGTKYFINKVLFELISVYDFKAKFTVVYIELHKWDILWYSGIYPDKAIKEYVDEGGNLSDIREDDEADGFDFSEDADEDDLGIRHFSVQLISSKGSCQRTLDDLSFYNSIFEGWSEIFSGKLMKADNNDDGEGNDGAVLPFVDITRISEEVALSFIHGCFDLRYALQQVDNAGTDIFFRTPKTDSIIASMYHALSMVQGVWPNKLNTGEYRDVEVSTLNGLLQVVLSWNTPLGDMIVGLKTLTPSEKEHVVGRALLEMWHQMCDVHTSYTDCPHKEVPVDGGDTKYSIIDYDITTRGASLVTTLNTITTSFVMEALNEFDDIGPLFQSANAALKESGYADKEITPESFAQAFLEAPLRALAYSGQIEAGHWIRNGENLLLFEVLSRRKVDVSYKLALNDLRSLQLCAALMPRDLFVHTVLDRFGVGSTHPAALGSDHVRPAVVYSALDMLLLVALEKWYLPRVDPVAATRHAMIQLFASEASLTYQSGRELCGPMCEKHYDDVLQTVAERVNEKYRLIDSLWDTEVTPYFFFFTSATLGDLIESYEIHLKRNKRPIQALPCPKVTSAPEHPLFKNLPGLLASRPLHALIAQALCSSKFKEDDDSNPPESQVYVLPCLHIIYLCLTSKIVCPSPSDADAVVEEALRDVDGTCTVAVLCKIHRKYSENEALTAEILRLLAARNPACRAAAESAFEALGAPGSFKFDVTPTEKSGEKAKRRENRKRHQNNAMSKLRAKQFAFLKNMEEGEGDDDKGADGETEAKSGDAPDTPMEPSKDSDEKADAASTDASNGGDDANSEDDMHVCVFCHGREGKLGRMGYAQKSDMLSRIEEVAQDSVTLGNSLPEFDNDNTNSMLEFLANGLRCGIYVQRCKHCAHSECLSKYIMAGNYAHGNLLDRDLLQYTCPACMRLSNIFISDDDTDDENLFLPLCYMDNGEQEVYPKQKLFYLVCRALGYTSASYELAARSSGPLAAYLTQERSSLLSTLLLNAQKAYKYLTFTEEETMDSEPDIPSLLDALITPEPSKILARIHNRTLFSIDTFNVFIMYMASLEKTEKVDGAFILNLLIAEMCKVRSAIASSQQESSSSGSVITAGQIAKYCVPFLRRVLTVLASTSEAHKGILAGVTDEYDFYSLVALLKLPRLPIISSSFADTPISEALDAPGCNVASDFFNYLEVSNPSFVVKTTPVNAEDRFRLVFSLAKPFHLSVFKPSIEKMILDYSKAVCPKCKTHPKYPCVCLICGKFVCPFAKCCDHECNKHIKECVRTYGLFYVVTVNYVVFFRSDHKLGTLYNSPYVDSHGEKDIGYKRGQPMTLNPDDLHDMEMMILNYEIDFIASSDNALILRNVTWSEY